MICKRSSKFQKKSKFYNNIPNINMPKYINNMIELAAIDFYVVLISLSLNL